MEIGTVTSWLTEGGWGVLESSATPGGCWVSFSVIETDGYRSLETGAEVHFEFEAGQQDGYGFRATRVWPDPGQAGRNAPVVHHGPSSAYQSTLTITFDDGRMLTGEAANQLVREHAARLAQDEAGGGPSGHAE